jgi:hypothetical protein
MDTLLNRGGQGKCNLAYLEIESGGTLTIDDKILDGGYTYDRVNSGSFPSRGLGFGPYDADLIGIVFPSSATRHVDPKFIYAAPTLPPSRTWLSPGWYMVDDHGTWIICTPDVIDAVEGYPKTTYRSGRTCPAIVDGFYVLVGVQRIPCKNGERTQKIIPVVRITDVVPSLPAAKIIYTVVSTGTVSPQKSAGSPSHHAQ